MSKRIDILNFDDKGIVIQVFDNDSGIVTAIEIDNENIKQLYGKLKNFISIKPVLADSSHKCKHIWREGDSCNANENCKYPNCPV